MLLAVVPVAIFFLLFFLGFVESHWIAPAVLFIVAAPIGGEFLWSEPAAYVIESLLGLLAFFYASFAIGRFLAPKKKVGGSLLGRRR